MATIERRTSKEGHLVYRVKVRRRGAPLQTATFSKLSEARKWAQVTEGAVLEGRHFKTVEAKRHTLRRRISDAWEHAVKRAGIENFRYHDLRHSCASYLAMNGASLMEIAEVLGHKTLAMVKRYTHLSEAHTAGVVARMNQAIFGQ